MFIQLNFFQNDLSLFLAVQDSSIGDLVTHSVSESVSQVTFDFCDNDKTFERLLRDFWETFERLLRDF